MHNFVGLILAIFSLSFFVGIRSSFLSGLGFLYCALSALFVFSNPVFLFGSDQFLFSQTAAQAFGSVVLVTLFALEINKKMTFKLFEIFAVLDSLLVLIFGFGAFNNGSMDASFLALMVPVIFWKNGASRRISVNLLISFPLLAAIVRAGGSTAYIILAVELFVILYHKKKRVIFAFVPFVFGVFFIGPKVFIHSSGRFTHWKLFMEWWIVNANIWLGTGAGSFEWIGPHIQKTDKNIFLFLHNEYLQVLFEYGIFGALIFFGIFLEVFYRARKTPWLFVTLSGLSIMFITQFPMRFFISQLFVLLLAKEAYDKRTA